MIRDSFILPYEAFEAVGEMFEEDEMKGLYLLWSLCSYGLTGQLPEDPLERAFIKAIVDREE